MSSTEWTYDFSENLKMKFAYRIINKKFELMTEDKILYNNDEINILNTSGKEISIPVHLVKKVFQGEIVSSVKVENWQKNTNQLNLEF